MAEFDPEWLFRLRPPRDPVTDDETYQAGARRLEERGDAQLTLAWYWQHRLAAALPQIAAPLQRVRYTSRIAAGFLPERDGEFGVAVQSEPPPDRPSPDPPSDASLTTLEVDGRVFPVVVREVVAEPHWCTAPQVTSPSSARATCWVRSPSRGYEGWLLPRHAVQPLSAGVDFDDGGVGQVVDHFGECIDAVVVSSDKPPSGLVRAGACWPVTPGQGLEVTDAPGSHVPVTVMDADLNLGVVSNVVFAVRFSTDWIGVPGQSGALVIHPTSGEPAGSYLGELRPALAGYALPGGAAPPAATGYAQACHQLETATGMEFFL